MSDMWVVRIETSPHSTGEGASVDQTAAGARFSDFTIQCDDAGKALEIGKLIMQGIRNNPRVWQTQIVSIMEQRWALAATCAAIQSTPDSTDQVNDG